MCTSLLANSCALTALDSGTETNSGTGITTPDGLNMFDCPPIHEISQNPQLGDSSNEDRLSGPTEFTGEEPHTDKMIHVSQNTVHSSSSNMSQATSQVLEEWCMRDSLEDVFADAHFQAVQTPISTKPKHPPSETEPIPLSRRMSSSFAPGDSSQHSTGSQTDIDGSTVSLGTTLGFDEEQESKAPFLAEDKNEHEAHNIDMSELLKTSNRLLEDGRRLLEGRNRQPRQGQLYMSEGEDLTSETSHKGPQSSQRRQSEGWYAYELVE